MTGNSNFSGSITKHFTWEEATVSAKAAERKIDNYPTSDDDVTSIHNTAKHLEEVRAYLNTRLAVNSWYRNDVVNHLVGGVPNSQHRLGEAVDVVPLDITIEDAIRRLKRSTALTILGIDQLLQYKTFIHISFISHPSKQGKLPRGMYVDYRGR